MFKISFNRNLIFSQHLAYLCLIGSLFTLQAKSAQATQLGQENSPVSYTWFVKLNPSPDTPHWLVRAWELRFEDVLINLNQKIYSSEVNSPKQNKDFDFIFTGDTQHLDRGKIRARILIATTEKTYLEEKISLSSKNTLEVRKFLTKALNQLNSYGITPKNEFTSQLGPTPIQNYSFSKRITGILILILVALVPGSLLLRSRRKLVHKNLRSSVKLAFMFSLLAIGISISDLIWNLIYKNSENTSQWAILIKQTLEQINLFKTDHAWIWPFLGGIAWGAFFLIHLKIIFPPLYGLERIHHWNILPLLRAWLIVVLIRAAALCFIYIPFLVLSLLFISWFNLDRILAYTLLIPGLAIVFGFWLSGLTTQLIANLDKHYVSGINDVTNSWHWPVKKYFLGYLKRLGLSFDPDALDRVIFLPGSQPGHYTYGGGLSAPRIVIQQEILEHAMGPIEDQVRMIQPESTTYYSISGLITPHQGSERTFENSDEMTDFTTELKTSAASINYQRHSTLGFVLPFKDEESVPLISNTDEDFETVQELITEHHQNQITQNETEELDDTDPTDKDYLFGILLKEFGHVLRGESFLHTLWLTFEQPFIRSLTNFQKSLLDHIKRSISRYTTIIADSFVALNFGRHHLIQYLFHERSGKRRFLTARADNEKLLKTSRELLEEVKNLPLTVEDQQIFRATTRSRLIWLSQFFYNPLVEAREVWLKKWFLAGAVAVPFILILFLIAESVDYRTTYNLRMEEQKIKIEEFKNKQKELNHDNKNR